MDYWMLAAALISAMLLLAHIVGGGKEVHEPMLESDLTRVLKAYTSVIWHAITAILAIDTGALYWAAMGRGGDMALIVGAQYLAFVGLFLGYGILRLKSIWVMPQWTAFLLISVLIGVGLWG